MTVEVPVFEFTADPDLERAFRQAAERVIASRRYVLDREVNAFEAEFADFCGASHCIGVANGTDALELALRGVGIVRGDRVATVANAGYYSCAALAAIGALPVFVDVDETLTMSPEGFSRVVHDVAAVVVTHLYGRLAAVEQIVASAAKAGVPVVEDCAHAHGARRNGKLAGTFGIAGCFSFYPTKNLGALGDGGAIVTSDPALRERTRALREYGWSPKYRVELTGGRNSRLDEMQAAFLRAKLPCLDRWNAERIEIALRYGEGLRDVGLKLPEHRDREHVSHLYVVRSRDRAGLQKSLASRGIGFGVHFPIPDHRQPACASAAPPELPVTESACREVLTLPCYPGLSETGVARVLDAVRRHYDA